MQNKHRFLFFSLAGILMALLLSAASIPISGDGPAESRFYESRQDNLLSGSEQTSPCMAILMEAAKQAGVKGTPENPHDSSSQGCFVIFNVSEGETGTSFDLFESLSSPEESCAFSSNPEWGVYQLTTFHGYNAHTGYRKSTTGMSGEEPWTFEGKLIEWCMHKGERNYQLWVNTFTASIERFGPAQDPLPIAEVLWSIAEDRLPLSEAPADGAEQPSVPVDPGEVVPGQPELPTDQTVPTDTGGLFGIPAAIILGSLGIPVAGAVAGAVLSAILSDLTSAGVSSADMTKAGASLADGVDKLIVKPVDTSLRAGALIGSLEEIDQGLLNRNIYVTNKFQSLPGPGMIVDGMTKLTNIGWDRAVNAWTGSQASSQGFTCEDYVQNTEGDVKAAVQKYFPDAEVVRWDFYEESSRNPTGVVDELDAINEDNHTLFKLKLIDGTELSIDFHGHNASNLLSNPPILRPFEDTRAEWMKRLGAEFREEKHKYK